MKRPIICPSCHEHLKVIETEAQSEGFSEPIVFSCANCGHFLGISPYVLNYESQIANIDSDVSRLHKAVEKLLAALPSKKAKKSK